MHKIQTTKHHMKHAFDSAADRAERRARRVQSSARRSASGRAYRMQDALNELYMQDAELA